MGDLNHTDVDNTNDVWQTAAAGSATTNGYGTYQLTAAGVWTYTLDNSNAAVQALIGFTLAEGTGNGLRRFLPFEVRDVEIFAPCMPRMRAVVRRGDAAAGGVKIERFDIDLCDEEGSVAVHFRGLSTRSTRREAAEAPVEAGAFADTVEQGERIQDADGIAHTYDTEVENVFPEQRGEDRLGSDWGSGSGDGEGADKH